MNAFTLVEPKDLTAASVHLGAEKKYSLPVYKAGGIDLLDQIKEGLIEPDAVINLRGRLPSGITLDGETLTIGAGATLAQVGGHALVREHAPALAQASESAATPAIRAMATVGGNLLQRPRCWYFRYSQFNCLKKGGDQCFAVNGENEYHAIFGEGPCHIVHPSNLAPALAVHGGSVMLSSGRKLTIPELYHMPDRGVRSEHNLKPGEIVTSVSLTINKRSAFYAVKHKQSFDWPLAFVCVGLDVKDGVISGSRVYAGAVAPVPWRLAGVERVLAGIPAQLGDGIAQAATASGEGSTPMRENVYKVSLLKVCTQRAILKALGLAVPGFEGGNL
jgi:xanthine dehydrogenase YagS FAD-binding subunit